jgi:acid phosphatase
LVGLCLTVDSGPTAGQQLRQSVPQLQHIIMVVMENHSYNQVRFEPYTASLIDSGASFGASYGVTHPSQPNYLALWSGGTQGVIDNSCPPPGSPFSSENLGHACEAAGVSWRAYSEDLPYAGWAGCSANGGLYHRRHCPWTHFGNLNPLNERPYTDLAVDIANGTLPTLAFVTPNNCHNTHDCAVSVGDAWLAANIPAMLSAVGPNGLVVLTWDEDNGLSGNQILTVFAGASVRPGLFSMQLISHYTVLRTICDALGVSPFGTAVGEIPIVDVWVSPSSSPDGTDAARLMLGPVFPNPSAGAFEVRLFLPTLLPVETGVYDAAGRSVATVGHVRAGVDQTIRWDGRDDSGSPGASGLYFLRVRVGETVMERKLLRVR